MRQKALDEGVLTREELNDSFQVWYDSRPIEEVAGAIMHLAAAVKSTI